MKKILTPGVVRTIAVIAVIVGAMISVGLVLYKGRNNDSFLLILLFVMWVLSPFIALLVGNIISKRWPVPTRVRLYGFMLFLTIGSLITYSGVLSPPATKPAFVFLVIPLISWVLIGIAALILRKYLRKNNSV